MRTLHALDTTTSPGAGWTLLRRLAMFGFALVLAACGGSADAPPPPESAGPTQTAPSITQQPADASVVAPATATFTAASTGTPAPTVQWEQSTDAGTTWTAIAGATSASFTTPATVLADSGTLFRAVFSNAAGSATSNAARLTVTTSGSGQTGLSLLAGDIGGGGSIDGTGSASRFSKTDGLVVDPAGNIFVADTANHTIRKITSAGVVTTVAGTAGLRGNADGTGAAARFSDPMSIAIDSQGNLFVADFSNSLIRKITPAGVVTTFAGGGSGPGVDGTGTAALFSGPLGIAIDAADNLYVADEFNQSIRKITPAAVVSTFAGQNGVSGDNDGTGTGARFNIPTSVAVDSAGNVYVGEGSAVVRKISPAGVVVTLAGSAAASGGSTDGTGAAARFSYPRGLAVDAAGNVYVADANNGLIRKITPAGVVTTLAGTLGAFTSIDGTGSAATFDLPSGIAVDAAGTIYVAEENGFVVRKVTSAGVVTTIAGDASHFGNVDASGAAARFNFGGNFGGQATTAVDASGNVFLTDFENFSVRKITPAGVVSTFLANTGGPQGLAIDAAGNVYLGTGQTVFKITPGGVSSLLAGSSQGSADGTGAAAQFGDIAALALDAAGNLYATDSLNDTIRKITPAGVVTTIAGTAGTAGSADGTGAAATFSTPSGIAIDTAGNLYVTDAENGTIRKVTPAGVVTTIAGTAGVTGNADGTGAAASFNFPFSIAVDSTGNLYVAELQSGTIRKITPAGVVTTVVGVAGQIGVRLGSDARLARASGLSLSGDRKLILVSANAVLVDDLP
jgi:sugar lactone lactonase YvrE